MLALLAALGCTQAAPKPEIKEQAPAPVQAPQPSEEELKKERHREIEKRISQFIADLAEARGGQLHPHPGSVINLDTYLA